LLQQTRDAHRLLVWDAMKEWTREGRIAPVASLQDLHGLVVQDIRAPAAVFRYGWVGPVNQHYFGCFCALAWPWMRRRPGVLVVEELADVTSPGKAPGAWGNIVREGRHTGSDIYAATQRPTESDSTIAGNCDVMHCGRQSFPRDRRTIADYLAVPVAEVASLQNLEFIERDMRTGRITRGRLAF
jgi:hypothetical protein